MNQNTQEGTRVLFLIVMQAAVAVYSFSGAAGKLASAHAFIAVPFILLYGLEILCLGVYAILWQQIIKRFELSVAYVNRAMSLLWSLVWSAFLFNEHISIQNIIGVVIVVCGVALVNTGEKEVAA